MTQQLIVDERPLVQHSMQDFLEAHPALKYVFFGGKGGVGKTVMAGVTAIQLAQSGKRVLLASTNPERLHDWYVTALEPEEDTKVDGYRVLTFGGFHVLIDRRDDIGDSNPEPGRVILNFDVPDARAIAARLDAMGVTWLAELEDRDGSLFATAIDPDGNYVQFIQLSPEHRAAMAQAQG